MMIGFISKGGMWKIQEDKRIIEFEIAGYNSQIFISVRNSYDMESIINQKQKFITTKEDKLNHGIGLENLRKNVKKYDGDMRISKENTKIVIQDSIPAILDKCKS